MLDASTRTSLSAIVASLNPLAQVGGWRAGGAGGSQGCVVDFSLSWRLFCVSVSRHVCHCRNTRWSRERFAGDCRSPAVQTFCAAAVAVAATLQVIPCEYGQVSVDQVGLPAFHRASAAALTCRAPLHGRHRIGAHACAQHGCLTSWGSV